MSPKLAEYIAQGKRLSVDERELAVIALQQVDVDEQDKIGAAWDDEVDCRIDEILSGDVELVDGEETRRMIRAELAARRK